MGGGTKLPGGGGGRAALPGGMPGRGIGGAPGTGGRPGAPGAVLGGKAGGGKDMPRPPGAGLTSVVGSMCVSVCLSWGGWDTYEVAYLAHQGKEEGGMACRVRQELLCRQSRVQSFTIDDANE